MSYTIHFGYEIRLSEYQGKNGFTHCVNLLFLLLDFTLP